MAANASVPALLAQIEAWLAANRPDYFAQLRPGVGEAALDAFESRFDVQLPAAFRALYQWRDGQDAYCFESLRGNRTWSSLEEVADTKEMLDGMIGFDFDAPSWWRRGWVPFLHNGGGSHLCVDTRAEDGGTPGQLVAFWKADADRPVVHASIEAWLAGLAASMQSGTLELD